MWTMRHYSTLHCRCCCCSCCCCCCCCWRRTCCRCRCRCRCRCCCRSASRERWSPRLPDRWYHTSITLPLVIDIVIPFFPFRSRLLSATFSALQRVWTGPRGSRACPHRCSTRIQLRISSGQWPRRRRGRGGRRRRRQHAR